MMKEVLFKDVSIGGVFKLFPAGAKYCKRSSKTAFVVDIDDLWFYFKDCESVYINED